MGRPSPYDLSAGRDHQQHSLLLSVCLAYQGGGCVCDWSLLTANISPHFLIPSTEAVGTHNYFYTLTHAHTPPLTDRGPAHQEIPLYRRAPL